MNSPVVNPLIFRAYDIRGIAHNPLCEYPIDLNPQTTELIGKAVGSYLIEHSGPRIVIGGDNRLSTPELKEAFIRGLLSTGCEVTDIGLSPSPLLYYATCKLEMDGGVNITASHNPKEYNGVKVVGKKAHAVCGDELQKIYKKIQEGNFIVGEGSLNHRDDLFELYLEEMKQKIHIDRPLKIIVDAGNGVTGPFVGKLFRAFGCEVEELFCEPDGNFPNHEANPEDEENLQELIAKMKKGDADIGIGFDGDGDRIGIIDETGKHYAADLHLLLLAKDMLKRNPGAPVVFDVKASQIVPELIKKYGGKPIMAKTGHSFIEKAMHEHHALLAGEVSGHLFFGEDYYGFDDAFTAALKTLAVLGQSTLTLSQHFQEIPQTHATPEIKVHCPDNEKFQVVEALKNHFLKLYECITLDGVRIHFDKNTWGIIRCSNTTPNLTMRFEALDPERLREVIQIVGKEMKKYPATDSKWITEYSLPRENI